MMRSNKKSSPLSPFVQYREALSEPDAQLLAAFFFEFDSHCALPRGQKERLRADYEDALLWYAASGVPLGEALARLDIGNLGGFYVRPPIRWYALDDAAKIYPLSMKRGQMAVFRLSVYLKEPVVPELLQIALTHTIKRFPSFATTVKKGFFWHYLDTAKRRFAAEPDPGLPCQPLQIAGSGLQSLRVLYYRNRISVEFFHILTDGAGGLCFLKTLAAEYLRLRGVPPVYENGVLDVNGTPTAEETANEFIRADKTEKKSGFMDRPAVQMSGRLADRKPCRVLHFKMDAGQLKAAAGTKGGTVTAYVLAQMFLAGRYATDEPDGDMSIQVPVDMRKYYPSATVRNFSLYCGIRLPIGSAAPSGGLISDIARQLAEKSSREAMGEMMSSTESMVRAVRYVPLFIKAPAARLVYGFLGDRIFSNTLSNLGAVRLPAALAEHIDSMDFVLGTALTNRAGCALVTCGNTATLSVSKTTADPSFEEKLYELLRADGIDIRAEGSELCEN